MAVRAVPRVDGVVVAQLGAHGRGDPLLAHAEVDQAVHLVGLLEPADAFLEHADPPHRREQAQCLLAAERRNDHYAVTGADPSTCRTAATTLLSSGMTKASSGWL